MRAKYALYVAEPRNDARPVYINRIQCNLLHDTEVKDPLVRVLKELAVTAHAAKAKYQAIVACKVAARRLVSKSLELCKCYATTLIKMTNYIRKLNIIEKHDFGECRHSVSFEPYFYDSAYK